MDDATIRARSELDPTSRQADLVPPPVAGEVRTEPNSALPTPGVSDAEVRRDEEGPIPPYPPRRYDAHGQQLPYTHEELLLRAEIFRREMALIDRTYQEPPGSDEEFMRAMDSHRPEGMKLFDRYY